MFILDNEFSMQLKATLKENQLNYQLVPPNIHRRNAAKRAIQTFKNHYVSVLATAGKSKWDILIPQAEMTLSLLRPVRYNPNYPHIVIKKAYITLQPSH